MKLALKTKVRILIRQSFPVGNSRILHGIIAKWRSGWVLRMSWAEHTSHPSVLPPTPPLRVGTCYFRSAGRFCRASLLRTLPRSWDTEKATKACSKRDCRHQSRSICPSLSLTALISKTVWDNRVNDTIFWNTRVLRAFQNWYHVLTRRVPWLSHSDLLETSGDWSRRQCKVSHVKISCWSLVLLC